MMFRFTSFLAYWLFFPNTEAVLRWCVLTAILASLSFTLLWRHVQYAYNASNFGHTGQQSRISIFIVDLRQQNTARLLKGWRAAVLAVLFNSMPAMLFTGLRFCISVRIADGIEGELLWRCLNTFRKPFSRQSIKQRRRASAHSRVLYNTGVCMELVVEFSCLSGFCMARLIYLPAVTTKSSR